MKSMITLSLMFSFLSLPALAQEKKDLLSICQGKNTPENLIIFDQGFCAEYKKMRIEEAALKGKPDDTYYFTPQDKWKLRLYASHSYTTYFNSDVTFQSSRYSVEIKDYEWAERSSREFFEPQTWAKEGNNPFQMIDEPTNTFTLSLEKNGNEFFISAFHPKFLQAPDQIKQMKGTIDGVAVDGIYDVNKPFDGYDQTPGESELVTNRNTHKQMTFEVGYGHRFTLIKGKFGNISFIPSIGLGVMVGENVSVMIAKDQWWEFDEVQDNYGIQGYGGSITNRLEFNTRKERFGMFYENKLGYYQQNHGFMDGTQKYNVGFMGNSVGIKFMIYNPKNHKPKFINPYE
jgi:hypothetical protein